MGYLYGDATPFPLDENFIETLLLITDCCVDLYKAESAGDVRRQQIRDAQVSTDMEVRRLQQLAQVVENALANFPANVPQDTADAAAQRVAESASAVIQSSIDSLMAERDAAIRRSSAVDVAESVRVACSTFMAKRQLPDTVWGATWKVLHGSDVVEAKVKGVAPHNIHMVFEAVPGSVPFWSSPIKTADLVPDLFIMLAKEPGLLSKGGSKKESLHKMVVSEVNYTPGKFWLIVRPSTSKPSSGFKIVIRDGNSPVPTVTKIDSNNQPTDAPERLRGESAANVNTLWNGVAAHIDALIASRRKLVSVRHGDSVTDDCEYPGELAEAMLASVAPLVLEMRKRSRVPGELALKRELGGGRREELFVPREELFRKFAPLPDHQRRTFEAMGLGSENTEEFQTSLLQVPRHGPNDVTIEADEPDDDDDYMTDHH